MKYDHLERQEIELTCISPVHIGSGEAFSSIDYVYDDRNKRVYFLDETKWKTLLYKKNLFTDLITYIQRNRQPKLFTWLSIAGLSIRDIQEAISYSCQVVNKEVFAPKAPGRRKTNANDIHRFITNGKGLPYIPGSSIKGTLRSGLLFKWLQQHPEMHAAYWRDIQRHPSYKWHKYKNNLETTVFSKLQLKDTGNPVVKSCLRGLSVSDTLENATIKETILLQKIDASTKRNKQGHQEHTLPLFRECLPAGTKLRFIVTFDKDMMAEIGVQSIADVLQASREFTAYNLAMEKRVFGREYVPEFKEAALADMMLGGGAGFQSKTIFYALAPSFETGKFILADKLNNTFKKHHHKDYDTQIAPRTLKLTRTSSERWIMGLCSLQEV